ncbi:MAG TPA: helix-turn-helix transcriptional regulator [Polyangiaceae bacterium]|nr:helix-turn-helix transcriptional regulator [Polyangiaceae bacterium]
MVLSPLPREIRVLAELRKAFALSQEDLALLVGVRQPALSKIERRPEVSFSQLRRYVTALGGTLHVAARFSAGVVVIDLDEEEPESGRPHVKARARSAGPRRRRRDPRRT